MYGLAVPTGGGGGATGTELVKGGTVFGEAAAGLVVGTTGPVYWSTGAVRAKGGPVFGGTAGG